MYRIATNFLFAWLIATFVAAVAYLFLMTLSIDSLYELIYGLTIEMLAASIPVILVSLPLTFLVCRYQLHTLFTVILFFLFGAMMGALAFNYYAGGELHHALRGGSIPGSISGFAFFCYMHLTRTFSRLANALG